MNQMLLLFLISIVEKKSFQKKCYCCMNLYSDWRCSMILTVFFVCSYTIRSGCSHCSEYCPLRLYHDLVMLVFRQVSRFYNFMSQLSVLDWSVALLVSLSEKSLSITYRKLSHLHETTLVIIF